MSWRYKIILAFVLFFLVIGILVYRSVMTPTEMVSEEYYKDEIKYQDVIDASKNSNELGEQFRIEQNNRSIRILMPDSMAQQKVTGNVSFYCAYDQSKDLNFDLKTDSSGRVLYDETRLQPGTYTLKVTLNSGGTPYYLEKYLSISQ